MQAVSTSALLILVLFTFGSAIFYFLLLLERKTWGLVSNPDQLPTNEADVRFVHRALKHLIPVLPPSNGVVVVGGLVALVWQAVHSAWTWPSLMVLGYWFAGQVYIILIGRIATAIKDVWRTPSEAPLREVARGVRNLIRQHRNGLIHALGVLVLELILFVLPNVATS